MTKEMIQHVPLRALSPFPDHPFKVVEDDSMKTLMESIRNRGVLSPIVVRPLENNTWQIISGHRRKYACEQLGLETIPAVIKDMDLNEATIMMVESNFQRESLLPSERAKAYKMKLDAMKRQGARNDLTSAHRGQKLQRKSTRDQIAETSPDSSTQIQRYVRLNELIPEILDMVDKGRVAVTPAVEISYFTAEVQAALYDAMEREQATPSLSQARRMRELSKTDTLTAEAILSILKEPKKPDRWNLTLPINKISRYFPLTYTPQQMQETIIRLLEAWLRKNMKLEEEKKRRNEHE